MRAPDHLGVDERLDTARKEARHDVGNRGALGEQVVLGGEAQRRLVLVVDDDGLAVGVDVHAVDGALDPHARVLDAVAGTAEVPLEEARLVAGEKPGLVAEVVLEVGEQARDLAVLLAVVGDEGLEGRGAVLAPDLVLVREVLAELVVEHLAGDAQPGLGVAGELGQAPGGVALRHGDELGHAGAVLVGLGALLALPDADEVVEAQRQLDAAGEQVVVRDLQDAVGEGAHLGAREAGVAVRQAQPAQAEPLVGALEVGLDLGGGQQRRLVGGRHALGRRAHERTLVGAHDASGGGTLHGDAPRGLADQRRVEREGRLAARRDAPLPEPGGDALGRGVGGQAHGAQHLAHHHAGVGELAVAAEDEALEHDVPAGGAHGREQPRAGAGHGVGRGLDAPGGHDGGERVVGRGHLGLGGRLAHEHDAVLRARGEKRRAAGREEQRLGARGGELGAQAQAHGAAGQHVSADAEKLRQADAPRGALGAGHPRLCERLGDGEHG